MTTDPVDSNYEVALNFATLITVVSRAAADLALGPRAQFLAGLDAHARSAAGHSDALALSSPLLSLVNEIHEGVRVIVSHQELS